MNTISTTSPSLLLSQDPPRSWHRPKVGAASLLVAATFFILVFDNDRFWSTLFAVVDPYRADGWYTLCAFAAIAAATTIALAAPFSLSGTVKPAVSLLLVFAAVVSWFQDSAGTIIDDAIIASMAQTDLAETRELLTPQFGLHLAIHGLLPILLVARVRVKPRASVLRDVLAALATCCAALLLLVVSFWVGFKPISVLNRQHTELRMLVNPLYALYSAGEVLAQAFAAEASMPVHVGMDAVSRPSASGKPRVVVVVVGETARADRFALNGYGRSTTPRLAGLGAIAFTETSACGTATTVSVPCMFSSLGRRDFDAGAPAENLLHVLRRAGVDVLWRDNNTGCKNVCDGFDYESYRGATDPEHCDDEGCVDEILLEGLAEEILRHSRDLIVVLHQNGSHGPAYYRRYPDRFGVFKPECRSASPWECTTTELSNSYDNTILYTDYFLSRLAGVLDSVAGEREATMLYVSDHGESLGENGVYLHGLPYAIAPREQTRVPMVFWQGGTASSSRGWHDCLQARAGQPASHDNVFHTVLAMFGIRTQALDPVLNLLSGCQPAPVLHAGGPPRMSARHAALEQAVATHPQVR